MPNLGTAFALCQTSMLSATVQDWAAVDTCFKDAEQPSMITIEDPRKLGGSLAEWARQRFK
jgi:hypothetical protein